MIIAVSERQVQDMQQESCLHTGSRLIASPVIGAWVFGMCVCQPGSQMQSSSLQRAYRLSILDWGMTLLEACSGFEIR